MIVRRKGGLTEFIPSPQEKREGLIRDHVFGMLENINFRLQRLEILLGISDVEAIAFADLLNRIKSDEYNNLDLYANLMAGTDI